VDNSQLQALPGRGKSAICNPTKGPRFSRSGTSSHVTRRGWDPFVTGNKKENRCKYLDLKEERMAQVGNPDGEEP